MESLEAITARSPGLASSFESGMRAIVTAPLISGDRTLGVLSFGSAVPGAYSQRDVAVVERVAAQIAGAIANARLHEQTVRDAHEREVLAEIGRVIGSSLDIDKVYERFADEVLKLIPFDRIVIAETDLETGASTNLFVAGADVRGWDPGALTELPLSGPGQLFAQWAGAAEPEPVVFGKDRMRERAESWPAEAAAIEAGLVSVIFVPIMWENAVIAHMALRSRTEDAYSGKHCRLAERVAAQIAGAIANEQSRRDLRLRSAAIESAADAAVFADGSGVITYANAATGRMFAWPVGELVGKPLAVLMPEEYWEGHEAGIERVAGGGPERVIGGTVELEGLRGDGQTFPLELSLSRVRGEESDSFVAVIRDISERVDAQAQRERLLRERAQRIKELRCMYGVQLAVQSHEKTEDVFREVVALIPEGWQYPEITRAKIRFEGREYVSAPFEETSWTQSAAIRVEGERRGAVEVFHLEERPEADEGPFLAEERQLIEGIARTLSEGAERRVNAAQARARQAEAMTTARLASIGELAAGVAHEINNPVNGIINYAELIMSRTNPEGEIEQFLGGIIREGERVASIVSNLLTFARDVRQEYSPARVRDILDASLELLGRRLEADAIEPRIDVPQDLPNIRCRSQQIQQVFINLITNARHALNEKYPQRGADKVLEISARPVELDGRAYVRVVFHDHGTGIPESVLPKVFDPFFSTKVEGEGTGLGLSISYGIVKDHNGRIHIESVEGEYTRVVVDLAVDSGWAAGS